MIMDDRIHAPQIRFSGFSDDWEQRKFIDIVERLNKTEDNVKLPRIEFEDIVSGEGRLNKDLNTKKDDRKGIFFDENNILYGKLRPYLRKWYYARFAGVAIGDFWVLKIINNNHPLFIYYLIQTEKYQRVANDTSGTKMPRSDWKKVSESLFYIPNINEQKKISTIFNIIDNLITLHQCKLDKLINIKKSMLEKMFVEKNTDVPEIRFKGFTDTWEQRKLGEVGDFNPKCSLPKKFEYVDLESVDGTRLVSHRTEYIDNAPSRAQRLAKPGDIFYQTVRPYQKNNFLFNIADSREYVFSTGYAQIRPYGNSEYLMALIQGKEFVREVLNNCTGTSYPAINSKDLEKISIFIPKINEQERIGNLFQKIDKLITLHQRKLEKLKNIKTSCLEKMFV